MNDITALMATMKAAAEKATEAHERLSAMPSDGLFDASLAENAQLESDITALIAHNDASTPANVLSLVEALEKAQLRISYLEAYSKTAIEFREAARDENRHLKLELEIAEKHITELEKAAAKPVAWTNEESLSGVGIDMCGMLGPKNAVGNIALYTVSPSLESRTVTASQIDYFASLVALARVSADKAMKKFPQPNYVLLKLAEEAGEVVQAGVHYAEKRMEWKQVESEIVQLLAMLIRLVTEGDQINGVTPPASCAAGIQVIEGGE